MATQSDSVTEVGARPGTSLKQELSGATQFEEQREDGTHKLTTVLPDGTVSRTIERTDPSTGITTKVVRHPDGRLKGTSSIPAGRPEHDSISRRQQRRPPDLLRSGWLIVVTGRG